MLPNVITALQTYQQFMAQIQTYLTTHISNTKNNDYL